MILFPNCKINLGLSVTGKRSDGFHTIESVFVPVPYNDVLEMVPSPTGQSELILSGSQEHIATENNICWKALQLIASDFDLAPVALYLQKNIPSGAGLGGGSADGAFTLKLLRSFFDLQLTDEDLKRYAARLGSDCPFFIENRIQYVTGRGEIMQPLSLSLSGVTIVVVYPSIHISTREAFGYIRPKPSEFDLSALDTIPRSQWRDKIFNDFEGPIMTKYPGIRAIKETLYNEGAFYASMSGSGSAVYGLFERDVDLRTRFDSAKYWKGTMP